MYVYGKENHNAMLFLIAAIESNRTGYRSDVSIIKTLFLTPTEFLTSSLCKRYG